MSDQPWTAADQAFYEWIHVHGNEAISLPSQRKIFMAGWNARDEQDTSGE